MCIWVYVCIWMSIVCECVYECVCEFVYVCVSVCMRVWMCMYLCVICECVYVSMFMWVCACVCVCLSILLYNRNAGKNNLGKCMRWWNWVKDDVHDKSQPSWSTEGSRSQGNDPEESDLCVSVSIHILHLVLWQAHWNHEKSLLESAFCFWVVPPPLPARGFQIELPNRPSFCRTSLVIPRCHHLLVSIFSPLQTVLWSVI